MGQRPSVKNRSLMIRIGGVAAWGMAAVAIGLCLGLPAHAATITVTSTEDDSLTDLARNGTCDLREALQAANRNIPVGECAAGEAGSDTISFYLLESSPGPLPPFPVLPSIRPVAELPAVLEPIVIDGLSQVDCDSGPCVEIDGRDAGPVSGLTLAAGGSIVRGLVINRFEGPGISILGPGNNVIEGNYIGTDGRGIADLGNLDGIHIDNSPDNTIGGIAVGSRNLISGNGMESRSAPREDGGYGVYISGGGSVRNRVIGNFIGTTANGTGPLGNAVAGVQISNAPGNQIGGLTPESRNVISGQQRQRGYGDGFGVRVSGASSEGNLIQGNFIGTDESGSSALGNDCGVLVLDAPDSVVGGTSADARNVISGNRRVNVEIQSAAVWAGSAGTVVQGNFIGTDATGRSGLEAETETGVAILYAPDILIGGADSGAGNVISDNRGGVYVVAQNVHVLGNLIGTDFTGMNPLPNEDFGVKIQGHGVKVGGSSEDEANTIAFNGGTGVLVVLDESWVPYSSTTNEIAKNSIHSNGLLGIDLTVWRNDGSPREPDGPTPRNDSGFIYGPNLTQSCPILSTASVVGSAAVVAGELRSRTNMEFTIRFFSNPEVDRTGYGEGRYFLVEQVVRTGEDGSAEFVVALPEDVPVGTYITATATDPRGNTSEFSTGIEVRPATISIPLPGGPDRKKPKRPQKAAVRQ